MKYLKESGKRYGLNESGVLVDHEGTPIPSKYNNGVNEVILDWLPGKIKYDLAKVILYIDRDLLIDPLDIDILKVYHTDGNSRNTHPSNLEFQYYPPFECSEKKGYFHIPEFHNYVISIDGKLFNLSSGRYIQWTKYNKNSEFSTGGYKFCKISRDNGNWVGRYRHRMLLMTFVEASEAPSGLVVNHLNGIPGDDDLDNLEWTTRAENIQHAYDNGLHWRRLVPVDIYYWKEKRLVTYNKLSDASKEMNIPYATLVSRLQKGPTRKWEDGYAIREQSSSPWPKLDNKVSKSIVPRQVIIYKPVENEYHICDLIKTAADFSGVKLSTVELNLKNNSNNIANGCVFRYENSEVPFAKYSKYQLELSTRCGSNIRPGLLVREDDGSEVLYTTREEYRLAKGLTKSVLDLLILKNPDKYFVIRTGNSCPTLL